MKEDTEHKGFGAVLDFRSVSGLGTHSPWERAVTPSSLEKCVFKPSVSF